VGVAVASGTAYLAIATANQILLDDPAEQVACNDRLHDAERLEDFRGRLGQVFRRVQPVEVGVARTTRFARWTYKDAFARFGLEAAVLIAAAHEGFAARVVTREEAARGAGVPMPTLHEQLAPTLGIERTSHWSHRALAIATAVALARRASRG
jgi:hypothetical protein